MKKIVFAAFAVLLTTSSFGQSDKKNEAHLNAFNIMVFKWVDASYERVINEESSAGISFSFGFSDEHSKIFNFDRSYAVTPYYRYYISSNNATGIFGEVFGMINGGEATDDKDATNPVYTEYSDFGFGVGGGYKFVSDKGLTLQAHGGIGRNLFDENAPAAVIRTGVTIGYRF